MDPIYVPHHQLLYCVKKWSRHPEVGEDCCVVKANVRGCVEEFVCQRNSYGAGHVVDFTMYSRQFPFAVGKWVPKYRISALGNRRIEDEQVPSRELHCEILGIYQIEPVSIKENTMPENKKQEQNGWDVSMSKTFRVDTDAIAYRQDAKISKDSIFFDDEVYDALHFATDLSFRLSVKAKYEKEFGKIKK